MGCGNNGLLIMGNRLTLAAVEESAIRSLEEILNLKIEAGFLN
jgi:hypothetical protein